MSLHGLVAYGSSDESEDEVNFSDNAHSSIFDKSEFGGEKKDQSLFNSLPKPRGTQDSSDICEAPVSKISEIFIQGSGKKEKGPVRISIPSLSEFKDVDEEIQQRKPKIQPSSTGTGLFSVLPPPSASSRTAILIPHVLKKPVPKPSKPREPPKPSALSSIKYDSNSEDETEEKSEDKNSLDFFSLESREIQMPEEAMKAHLLPPPVEEEDRSSSAENPSKTQTLRSTVMDLPRDEIILKNKTEVGPKLPVPEQEYHVDDEGNVAFDEKAIEYLCGKRGVKRKKELIQESNIIEINGEDIKPDEREWLVKALTEEQVQRPVSLSAGPSGASKKKHQITYLAHQAKAMELELQNQWAANRMSRKQTKSKYGF